MTKTFVKADADKINKMHFKKKLKCDHQSKITNDASLSQGPHGHYLQIVLMFHRKKWNTVHHTKLHDRIFNFYNYKIMDYVYVNVTDMIRSSYKLLDALTRTRSNELKVFFLKKVK